jgi:hypothetical protein
MISAGAVQGVSLQPPLYVGGLVSRVVIQDQVNLRVFSTLNGSIKEIEKLKKLMTSVSGMKLRNHHA